VPDWRHHHFRVVGSDTATRYRIRHGAVMNILKFAREGGVTQRCFVPEGIVAVGDDACAGSGEIRVRHPGDRQQRWHPAGSRYTIQEVVLVIGLGLMLALSVMLMWLFLYDLKIVF
jgi:hypothetical protein